MEKHWWATRGGLHRRPGGDAGLSGFGFVMLAVSLLITAALVVLGLRSLTGNGSSSSDNPSAAPGLHLADDLEAKQSLTSSLTSAQSQAAQAGGYGSVSATALGTDNPSLTYTSGASSSPTTVSVAADSAATTGATGTTSPGGALNPDGSDAAPNGGGGGSGGSVTLAAWSTSGTCWLIWQPTGGQAWYGAQTNMTNCAAPALSNMPTPGAPTSSTTGWQQGSFPAA